MDDTRSAEDLAKDPKLTPIQRALTERVYETLKKTAAVMHDLFGGSALTMVLTFYAQGDKDHPEDGRPVTMAVTMSDGPEAVAGHVTAAAQILISAAERLKKSPPPPPS